MAKRPKLFGRSDKDRSHLLPVLYCFIANEEQWKLLLKRYDLEGDYPPSVGKWATTTTWEGDTINGRLLAVTLHPELDEEDMVIQMGALAHECMHVWQGILEGIGEKEPSAEFGAYLYQSIFEDLLPEYLEHRGPKSDNEKASDSLDEGGAASGQA